VPCSSKPASLRLVFYCSFVYTKPPFPHHHPKTISKTQASSITNTVQAGLTSLGAQLISAEHNFDSTALDHNCNSNCYRLERRTWACHPTAAAVYPVSTIEYGIHGIYPSLASSVLRTNSMILYYRRNAAREARPCAQQYRIEEEMRCPAFTMFGRHGCSVR